LRIEKNWQDKKARRTCRRTCDGELKRQKLAEDQNTCRKQKFEKFLDNLQTLIRGEMAATLILDDPLANSYLQNLYAPDPDPNMTTVDYERTFDQNEDLGLNDMKVENYVAQ